MLFDTEILPKNPDLSTNAIRLYLLDIAGKKANELTKKVRRSANFLVHNSHLSSLPWKNDFSEEGSVSEETANSKEISLNLFDEKSEWTIERFNEIRNRAAILEPINNDILKRRTLRLQEKQEEYRTDKRQFWLLDGVAGTGKTTVLIARFLDHFERLWSDSSKRKYVHKHILYITFNSLLKQDFQSEIQTYLQDDPEMVLASKKCILTLEEYYNQLLLDNLEQEILKMNIAGKKIIGLSLKKLSKIHDSQLLGEIVLRQKEFYIYSIDRFDDNKSEVIPSWKNDVLFIFHGNFSSKNNGEKDLIFNYSEKFKISKLLFDSIYEKEYNFSRKKFVESLRSKDVKDPDQTYFGKNGLNFTSI